MTRLFSKRLLVAFTTLLFVAGGYSFLWFKVAEETEEKLIKEIAKLEDDGYSVRYQRLLTKGFPIRVSVVIENFSVAIPNFQGGIQFDSEYSLVGHVNIFNPHVIHIASTGPIMIHNTVGDNQPSDAFGVLQNVSLKLDLDHYKEKDLTLEGLKIADLLSIDSLKFGSHETLHTFEMTQFNSKSFAKIDRVSFKVQADLPEPAEPFVLKNYLQSLYEKDAVVDFKEFELQMDKLRIVGNGALSLSQDLQPILIMSTQTYNADSILTLLVEKKMIHKNLKPILKVALLGAAEQDKDSKEPVHKISINIQDQELSIANIPVTKFKEINWDTFTWQAK